MQIIESSKSTYSLQPIHYDQIEADRIVQETLKKKETKEITKGYVRSLADWNTWITISFRGGKMPLVKAQSLFERFMRSPDKDDITYFSAYELHNNGIGWHIHALAHLPQHRLKQYSVNVKDGKPTFCRKLWKQMFDEFGRTTISPIEDMDKVTDYCQKHVLDYTTKGDVRGLGVYDIKFGNGEEGKRFYHAHA